MAVGDTYTHSVPLFGTTLESNAASAGSTTTRTLLDAGLTSAYGTIIPILYGTMALNGNIIWTRGIEEIKTTSNNTTSTTTTTSTGISSEFTIG